MRRHGFLTYVILSVLCLLTPAARAQVFDLDKDRIPVTSLIGKWRFHPGDSPGVNGGAWDGKGPQLWAQPGFDDSQWPLLQSDKSWKEQGYPHLNGVAWYRFEVVVSSAQPSFLIALPPINSSYQLFADGRMVGQVGGLPPRARFVFPGDRLFTVPVSTSTHPQAVSLCLRVWSEPRGRLPPGLTAPAYAGSPQAVSSTFEEKKAKHMFVENGGDYVQYLIFFVLDVGSFILYILNRRETSYLWFSLSDSLQPWGPVVNALCGHFAISYLPAQVLFHILGAIGLFGSGMFLLAFVRERSKAWILFFVADAVASYASLFVYDILGGRSIGWYVALVVLWWAHLVGALIVLYLGARRGQPEAWLLFGAMLLRSSFLVPEGFFTVLHGFGYAFANAADFHSVLVISRPIPINLDAALWMCWNLGVSVVLLVRFARISRQEERLTTSLDAARHVQQRLIPAILPQSGGIRIEAAYHSAEEVAGDFYQVLTPPDGSLLVVIGDVSGKGLQAAMLGTLAVGGLRTLARYVLGPAEVLRSLNQQLATATENSFITCLCARFSPDGQITVANAGHIAPYLNGSELSCASGLPLGITPDAEYQQCSFPLPDHARITLLSDGVVEARNGDRELFGFERTLQISRMSAGEIAEAAKQFGQEDDITVLTLDWDRARAMARPAEARQPA